MDLKEMAYLSEDEKKKELDLSTERVMKETTRAKESTAPAHTECRFYSNNCGVENCTALNCLFCRLGDCSFEKPRVRNRAFFD